MSLRKSHRDVLTLIADRTTERDRDPGVTTSSSTFADTWTAHVHWRTARALKDRGLVEFPHQGGADEVWSIALTADGWAALDRVAPPTPEEQA